MRLGRLALISLVTAPAALLTLAGCSTTSTATPTADAGAAITGNVTVFAASSLTDAFTEMGKAFESANPGAHVSFNFAGTATLRTQLEQGAQADVFASANQTHMNMAVQDGVIDGRPSDFATNRLVIITPIGDNAVTSLADLANDGVKLVLALPAVPVGGYARQAIQNMDASGNFEPGFNNAVLGNVVSEELNVRQVSAKVALDEADAGIVYSTDVTPDIANRVSVIPIPGRYNVTASYPIAKVAEAPNGPGGQAFIDFVLSGNGQAILHRYGFGGAAP